MRQQQLGALVLVALGIHVAAGAGGSAILRLGLQQRRRQRSHEPLWGRSLATAGLVIGLIAMGMYYYTGALPHLLWLAQVAAVGFALAVAGYGATIAPALWHRVWGD